MIIRAVLFGAAASAVFGFAGGQAFAQGDEPAATVDNETDAERAERAIAGALDGISDDATAADIVAAISGATEGFSLQDVATAIGALIESGRYAGTKLSALAGARAVAIAALSSSSGVGGIGGVGGVANGVRLVQSGGAAGGSGFFEYSN